MMLSFIALFLLVFTRIAWRNIHHGVFLIFLLLPTYLIRFQIGPLPSTLLEGMILTTFLVWLIRRRSRITHHVTHFKKKQPLLFYGTCLFLLGATISIFTSVDIRAAAGEWKAFYIEPVLLALVIFDTFKKEKDVATRYILFPLLLCGLATSLLAIYQHFTGWMVPHAFWANGDSYRVTAWYGFPNGVGLFLAPLIPLALYGCTTTWKKWKNPVLIVSLLSLITLPLAILYAKSTGGLVGVIGGIGVLLLIWKKTRWPALIVGATAIMGVFLLPPENPIRIELLAQDRSGMIRRGLWSESIALLQDRPIFGAGLASYDERIVPYHETLRKQGIEVYHHPHNILLTLYVNIGLIGMIGFIMIIIWYFKTGLSYGNTTSAFLIATMTTLLVTGLVDSPYIKNDLSVFFWLLPPLLLLAMQTKNR